MDPPHLGGGRGLSHPAAAFVRERHGLGREGWLPRQLTGQTEVRHKEASNLHRRNLPGRRRES